MLLYQVPLFSKTMYSICFAKIELSKKFPNISKINHVNILGGLMVTQVLEFKFFLLVIRQYIWESLGHSINYPVIFLILWWPEYENHWPWATAFYMICGNYIYGAFVGWCTVYTFLVISTNIVGYQIWFDVVQHREEYVSRYVYSSLKSDTLFTFVFLSLPSFLHHLRFHWNMKDW